MPRGRPSAGSDPKGSGGLVQWAPAIGGIGTLLAGVAAILAIFVGQLKPSASDSSPSVPPGPSTASLPSSASSASTSALASLTPPPPSQPGFETIVFQSPLNAPLPGIGHEAFGSCSFDISAIGYSMVVSKANALCPKPLRAASSSVASLVDVSVEVTAAFTDFKEDPSSPYGAGDMGLECRVNGSPSSGNYYAVSVSTIGYWLVDRYTSGVEDHLSYATDPRLGSNKGDSHRLRLDCVGSPGGPTLVRLLVDGTVVGEATDPAGLPAGTVAIASSNYETPPITVTYKDVVVATP